MTLICRKKYHNGSISVHSAHILYPSWFQQTLDNSFFPRRGDNLGHLYGLDTKHFSFTTLRSSRLFRHTAREPSSWFPPQEEVARPSPVLKFPRACFIRTYIMGNSLNAFQNKAINRAQFYSEWSISIYFVGCKQQKGKVLHRRE